MLVGITGKKTSGKTYTANIIKDNFAQVHIVPLALPVKAAVDAILRTCYGTSRFDKDTGHIPGLTLNFTLRDLYKAQGTGFRNQLHPRIWIDLNKVMITPLLDQRHTVIIDDVRYANEAEYIKGLGGHLLRIVDPNLKSTDTHISETEMDSIDADWTLINEKVPSSYNIKVKAFIGRLIH